MLRLEGITAGYEGTRVLRDIGLEAKEGMATVLIGPNGAGKSTTLKVINGLLRPTGGRVVFQGEDITKIPPTNGRPAASRRARKVDASSPS